MPTCTHTEQTGGETQDKQYRQGKQHIHQGEDRAAMMRSWQSGLLSGRWLSTCSRCMWVSGSGVVKPRPACQRTSEKTTSTERKNTPAQIWLTVTDPFLMQLHWKRYSKERKHALCKNYLNVLGIRLLSQQWDNWLFLNSYCCYSCVHVCYWVYLVWLDSHKLNLFKGK